MTISIVVPTYRGQASLAELCARVAHTLDALGLTWEMVLVDDTSPDGTPAAARKLVAADPRLRYLRMPQHVGQHAATVAGLRAARGGVIVTMDDDLQQPPEAIPHLLAALEAGMEVAVARFPAPAHSFWRRAASRIANRLLWARHGGESLRITSFKALRRSAVERLLALVPDGPFYLGNLLLTAIPRERIANVDVPHHARRHGRSAYSPTKLAGMMFRLAQGRMRRIRDPLP